MTLLSALSEAVGRELTPDRVVVHRNVGLVPPPPGTPEDHLANRGFNLQLIGADGRSTHYVKCRSRQSARARHEARLLTTLGADPSTSPFVPPCQVVEVGDVVALVTGFVDARTLAQHARTAPTARVEALAREALHATDQFVRVLAPVLDPPRDPEADREDVLAALRELGTPPATTRELAERVGGLPALGSPPQHGDLTARNVLVVHDRPLLIDLEAYGEVRDPLFDAWSLVRSLPGPSDRRLRWWQGGFAELARERAERAGLDATSMRTLLAWFLGRSASLLHRRAAPADFAAAYVRELQELLGGPS